MRMKLSNTCIRKDLREELDFRIEATDDFERVEYFNIE